MGLPLESLDLVTIFIFPIAEFGLNAVLEFDLSCDLLVIPAFRVDGRSVLGSFNYRSMKFS